jgi:hypothetical protein
MRTKLPTPTLNVLVQGPKPWVALVTPDKFGKPVRNFLDLPRPVEGVLHIPLGVQAAVYDICFGYPGDRKYVEVRRVGNIATGTFPYCVRELDRPFLGTSILSDFVPLETALIKTDEPSADAWLHWSPTSRRSAEALPENDINNLDGIEDLG